jgi:hypothetical protein
MVTTKSFKGDGEMVFDTKKIKDDLISKFYAEHGCFPSDEDLQKMLDALPDKDIVVVDMDKNEEAKKPAEMVKKKKGLFK